MQTKTIFFVGMLIGFTYLIGCAPAPDPIGDDTILSQHIKETDGSSLQDTNNGSGIKTNHIQDRAVTSRKISFHHNVIIVAPDGKGDFANPARAIDSIKDNSESNPYLVQLMPGIYNIGAKSLTMKEHVVLQGSGEKSTKILGSIDTDTGGVIIGSNNSEIRRLTVENSNSGENAIAIYNDRVVTLSIEDVSVIAFGSKHNYGIYNNLSSGIISNVRVKAYGGLDSVGIYNFGMSQLELLNTEVNVRSSKEKNIGVKSIDGVNLMMRNADIKIAVYPAATEYNAGVYNFAGVAAFLESVRIKVSNAHSNTGIVSDKSFVYLNNANIEVWGGNSASGARSRASTKLEIRNSIFDVHGAKFVTGINVDFTMLVMSNVKVVASDSLQFKQAVGVNTSSSSSEAHKAFIDHSQIFGSKYSILNNITMFVGNTKLGGDRKILHNLGTISCAGIYDQSYKFYANVCPLE